MIKVIMNTARGRYNLFKKPVSPGFKYAEPQELNKVFKLLKTAPQKVKLVLLFIIFTGVRINTAINLRWEHVKSNVIECPASIMKSNQDFIIPMTPAIKLLLDFMKQSDHKPNDLIFGYNAPVTINKYFTLLVDKMYTIHGFRKTMRTWCANHNINDRIAELLLAHQPMNSTELAYNKGSYLKEKRLALRKWQLFVLKKMMTNFINGLDFTPLLTDAPQYIQTVVDEPEEETLSS